MTKNIIGIMIVGSAILAVGFPFISSSHELGEEFEKLRGDGPGMMRFLEDQAVGTTRHEEMEALMEKMMSGTLSDEEAETTVTYMRSYPGAYGQMVGRIGMMRSTVPGSDTGGFLNMMEWGSRTFGVFSFLMPLAGIVWLIAGLALIAFLFRKLRTPSGPDKREGL